MKSAPSSVTYEIGYQRGQQDAIEKVKKVIEWHQKNVDFRVDGQWIDENRTNEFSWWFAQNIKTWLDTPQFKEELKK